MTQRLPLHALDPDGAADGDYAVEVTGGVVTGLVPSSSGTPAADDVSYDNSGSGLTATDVQGALDELAATGGAATTAYVLLTTTVGGVPELLWTADNELIYTEVPI